MDTTTATPDALAIIRTAQEAVAPHELEAGQLYAVRDSSGALVPLDLEKYRDRPDRRRGEFRPATVESLIDYVERHKGKATTIWVHPTEAKIVAVLDDHSPTEAAWRQHRAALTLIETEEWKFWMAGNKSWFDQEEFAERLQDGLPDIATPDASELLEIAQTLQGTTEAKFRSGVKLSNGEVKIEYDETIEATAGKHGDLAIPEVFQLAIAPFVGGESEAVTARLRWRVRGGQVTLGYSLEQPERIVQDALDRIADRLGNRFNSDDAKCVYKGTPAS
ncbi:MAG TPA: DUF2303 family protein [Solirubrobacterales bacterium]|nr:DUF2303 family protein [Solirubrobacterales bacterium]